MTDFSRLSRFGMMCKPLTENRGRDLLTWFLAGFHAKTLALQEKGQESMEGARGCGLTWRASLAKYDQDSHSWKTVQLSLLGDLELSSVIWPRSGMTAGGECWELPMLEGITDATGYGFVPNGETFFHTPNTHGMDGGSNSRKALKKRLMLPTPCATDSGSGRMNTSLGSTKPRPMLALMARKNLWPTPRAFMHKDSTTDRGKCNLGEVVGGQLNPTWTEWLMGWPLEWTDLKPLETGKSHCVLQQHGECSVVKGQEHE
jgi:DNA (cytosine-5)-methyltransferase 1